ncbi:MAG: ATP-binding cassette domain-containing protein [Bacteroides sp.]|nr:MAG: ATP-binding cassette domain-containing protein [Bacteroides sp.]
MILFKDLSYVFEYNKSYAIIGKNGIGKSTLAKILIGITSYNTGYIQYYNHILKYHYSLDTIYKHLSIVLPSVSLIENIDYKDIIKFHFIFKNKYSQKEIDQDIQQCNLAQYKNILYKNMSDGIKQKLKLLLAFNTNSSIIILDEPTMYLDKDGLIWYEEKLIKYLNKKKLIIIFSNNKNEYKFCENILNLNNYA